MEAIIGALAGLVEKGWRLGLILGVSGAAIIALHRHSISPFSTLEPNHLQIAGIVTVLGWAIVLTSFLIWSLTTTRNKIKRNIATYNQSVARFNNLVETIHALNYDEAVFIRTILQQNRSRVTIHYLNSLYDLVRADLLQIVGEKGQYEYICRPHPVLIEYREKFLEILPH